MRRFIPIIAGLSVLFFVLPTWAKPGRVSLEHIRRVVIDPGHGGENLGCMGYHGVFEKFVTLQIAKRLRTLLKKRTNATVFMTRDDDSPMHLRNRTRFANNKKADIFISIHLNASDSQKVRGVETYFLSTQSATQEISALVKREQIGTEIGASAKEEKAKDIDHILLDAKLNAAHGLSEKLAWEIHKYLIRSVRSGNRGVKQAPFAVLKESHAPAVVIECGFLTHPHEGESLMKKGYQNQIAEGILSGILSYDRIMGKAEGKKPR